MYQVFVPIFKRNENRKEILKQLHELNAVKVFLCQPTNPIKPLDPKTLSALSSDIAYFEKKGFEVGIWLSVIGHGSVKSRQEGRGKDGLMRITGLHGVTSEDSNCPLDDTYTDGVCRNIADIVSAGAKTIMLDDDFRLSSRGDSGCSCELHLKELSSRIGRPVSRNEILQSYQGNPNPLRSEWMKLQGDTLRSFCRKLRKAVDSVNPQTRLGACSCITMWDGDGTDSIEIAKILAGNTKPFSRLIGAPYWSEIYWGGDFPLSYVAELERTEGFWCRSSGVEIFSEGDLLHKTRYTNSATSLEIFDEILRADGSINGILKYGINYGQLPTYEQGYAAFSKRNQKERQEITTRFSDKTAVGVRLQPKMKTIENRVFPDEDILSDIYDGSFFQAEPLFLCENSIPITYDPSPVTMIFGENANYASLDAKGFILDAPGAMVLEKRGIDTGLLAYEDRIPSVRCEYFFPYQDSLAIEPTGLCSLSPKSGAEILSEYRGTTQVPAVIRYQNSDGQRFLILGCNGSKTKRNPTYRRSYYRQKQLTESYEWLCGSPLPAQCNGNPGLYIMVKRNPSSTSVGLWNISKDPLLFPKIQLDRQYARAEFIHCKGHLNLRSVRLTSDISPYSFAGFELFDPQK